MLNVYVVEDEPLVARHVRGVLDQAPGMRCIGHAASLAVARSELPQCRPDVLLSDLGLPDGDGTELIGELSHAPAIDGVWHPHILVFSGFGDEARVIQALEAGADGYFLKGCTAGELVAAVWQAARGGSPISPVIARHLLKHFREEGLMPDAAAAPAAGAERTVTGIMDLGPADGPEVSAREHEVLCLVAQGYVMEEIAARLDTTLHAVATDVRTVYRKLQLGQRSRRAVAAAERPAWA